jgi:Zn-dependent protease with chaperone function
LKYSTRLPDESVNVSSESHLAVAIKLTLSLTVVAIVGYMLLGVIVDYAVASLSPEQESRLVEFISIEAELPPQESPYLSQVTERLAACARLPYDTTIRIMEEEVANAFAMPGGAIYITRGMLDRVESENELAFILGHELGHFQNRDHLRMLGNKLIVGIIGMLLGGDYGTVATTTFSVGDARYSQAAELKADAFGLEVMQCAYGSVTAATRIFEKMQDGGGWGYFFATHPAFEKRVKKMREKIAKDGMDTSKDVVPLGEI